MSGAIFSFNDAQRIANAVRSVENNGYGVRQGERAPFRGINTGYNGYFKVVQSDTMKVTVSAGYCVVPQGAVTVSGQEIEIPANAPATCYIILTLSRSEGSSGSSFSGSLGYSSTISASSHNVSYIPIAELKITDAKITSIQQLCHSAPDFLDTYKVAVDNSDDEPKFLEDKIVSVCSGITVSKSGKRLEIDMPSGSPLTVTLDPALAEVLSFDIQNNVITLGLVAPTDSKKVMMYDSENLCMKWYATVEHNTL